MFSFVYGGECMRDEEYCEIMLEAYRDVFKEIIEGKNLLQIHEYIRGQIEFHVRWMEGQ